MDNIRTILQGQTDYIYIIDLRPQQLFKNKKMGPFGFIHWALSSVLPLSDRGSSFLEVQLLSAESPLERLSQSASVIAQETEGRLSWKPSCYMPGSPLDDCPIFSLLPVL